MPVKSYGFAIGNLRARENRLLKQSELLHLLSAEDTFELANMLKDKGIGDGLSNNPIQIIKNHTSELWQYLTDIAPDMAYFDPFFYENDFHNLKAILKCILKEKDYNRFIIVPATVDVKLIERAFKEKRFEVLPENLSTAAKKAYDVLSQSGDSQLADGIIDAACMTAQLSRAKECRLALVTEIIEALVFYSNIKVAIRAAEAQKTADFLEQCITENGVIPKKDVVKAALGGKEKVLKLLEGVDKLGGAQAVKAYCQDPWRFEKFVDDLIIKKVLRCKSITMGVEPLLAYMLARKYEIKNLNIIYSGIKTGQSREKIEERLREVYG